MGLKYSLKFSLIGSTHNLGAINTLWNQVGDTSLWKWPTFVTLSLPLFLAPSPAISPKTLSSRAYNKLNNTYIAMQDMSRNEQQRKLFQNNKQRDVMWLARPEPNEMHQCVCAQLLIQSYHPYDSNMLYKYMMKNTIPENEH